MIIGHFGALSTTVSSPIWTQVPYPEKGRFQCFAKTMNCTFWNAEMANSVLICSTALHSQMLSKFACSKKSIIPLITSFLHNGLSKLFKFWSLNHLMTRTSILQQKGLSICCSTEFPTTLPQPSEESSNKQADTNCVSLQQRQTLITYKGALLKTPSHPQTF